MSDPSDGAVSSASGVALSVSRPVAGSTLLICPPLDVPSGTQAPDPNIHNMTSLRMTHLGCAADYTQDYLR